MLATAKINLLPAWHLAGAAGSPRALIPSYRSLPARAGDWHAVPPSVFRMTTLPNGPPRLWDPCEWLGSHTAPPVARAQTRALHPQLMRSPSVLFVALWGVER